MFKISDIIPNIEFEGKEVEFKREFSSDDEKWCKTVAAFANTNGGVMIFGIDDDGNVIGLKRNMLDPMVQRFDTICGNRLEPHASYSKKEVKVDNDLYILCFFVNRSIELPVWYKKDLNNKYVFIRRESQTVVADRNEIASLVLASKEIEFDTERTNFSFNLKNFSRLNKEYRDNNNASEPLTAKLLKSKGAVTQDDYLTNAGLLFMDDTPFQNANVVCRCWPGKDKSTRETIDKKVFQGDLISLFEFSKDFIMFHSNQGFVKEDFTRRNVSSYPARAVEEAIINAIAHRDYSINGAQIDIDMYSDRLEIVSPGSFLLSGEVQDYNMNDIPSRRRNNVVCEILDMCNLMERSGTGFATILSEYAPYGQKYAPKVYSNRSLFKITLMNLNETFNISSVVENEGEVSIKYNRSTSIRSEHADSILVFCLSAERSKKEIMSHIGVANEAYFRKEILKPLVDEKLLLPTQQSSTAPNQKYKTNKTLVKTQK